MAQIKIGDHAPSFCLLGHDGKEYCLPELLKKGRVVLVFYPFDQSPRCTKLLCNINDDRTQFEMAGITLLGINNADGESHRLFAERSRLKMPLLSDADFKVAKVYNSLFQIGPIKAIRYTTVGIDTDGTIIFYEHNRPANDSIIQGMSASVTSS
jgi:thioredoxin-dependent peroxiredoxin